MCPREVLAAETNLRPATTPKSPAPEARRPRLVMDSMAGGDPSIPTRPLATLSRLLKA